MALRCPSKLLIAAIIMVVNTRLVESTVSYGGHVFESMPSTFGMAWTPPSRTYRSHLQFLPERAKLCKDGFRRTGIDGLEGIVLPNDTLPVALLVERGNCSFEEKATVAMQAHPPVLFVVVYDDEPSTNLVSMRETFQADGITLRMLFVSFHAGMALRKALNNQTENVLADGGPIIELNGLDPVLRDPSQMKLETWMLIATGGFLTFTIVFGFLVVLVQLGVIPVNGAGQITLTQDAIRRSRQLLTREEVVRLQPGGDLHRMCAKSDEETRPPEEPLPTKGRNDGKDATNGESGHSHVDHEEDQSCAVCLDELMSGPGAEDDENSTMKLPCGHNFHIACIVPWLTERHATCPLCNFNLLEFLIELDQKTTTTKCSRVSLTWWKQRARRLMGWSPVGSSDGRVESAAINSVSEESNNEILSER